MTWESVLKKTGKGLVFILKKDQEKLVFTVIGEPEIYIQKRKGQDRNIVLLPVLTGLGQGVLPMNESTTRAFYPLYERSASKTFTITRHGEKDNKDTKYTFEYSPELVDFGMDLDAIDPARASQEAVDTYRAFMKRCAERNVLEEENS